MAIASLEVDDICSDEQLANEIGGTTELARITPQDWESARTARLGAYEEILTALRKRSPPVLESDLTNREELRRPIAYGAAARLYLMAATSDDDVFMAKSKRFRALFDDEVLGLAPTVSEGQREAVFSISVGRR